MDPRERIDDLTLLLRTWSRGWQSNIWTALPGYYVGPGSKKGTAEVQTTVKVQFFNPKTNALDPPVSIKPCQDCPIVWPGGGGAHLSFPLAAGDEGLLVFASRCIDNWWLAGGIQSQAEFRMHDLSDGFFIPGCFSQPRAPTSDFSTSTVRLATDDGLAYVEIDPVMHSLNLVFPGGITINGISGSVSGSTLTLGGTLRTSGGMVAGAGGADQVSLQTHVHSGVQTGSGSTLAPTAGT